jgi:regulator of protease activity HflC (stomatin/prohibitin superfamily)
MSISLLVLLILGAMLAFSAIKILKEYEQAVIFRLGKYIGKLKGPGIIFLWPVIDKMERRVDLRVIALDVPPQDVITRDNVSVKVNAIVFYRVVDPNRAVIQVENYHLATSQKAQTTLRSVLGEVELDGLLAHREKINERLQEILDRETDPWGIKVSSVEVKHVDLPQEMQRAMARQAEAERERRSKVINAEGEYQAAEKLTAAAAMISKHPMALQLRFLQTLTEVASENNSTIVFPVPIDLLRHFIPDAELSSGQRTHAETPGKGDSA